MKTQTTIGTARRRLFEYSAICPLIVLAATCLSCSNDTLTPRTGTILGRVSSDRGVIRGFQVKARDVANRITYTVFTRQGRYQIPDLLPGDYEIRVVQKGFESPTHQVELKAGEKKTIDLGLTARNVSPPQAPLLSPEMEEVQLVDYDQLYPPGPGRDALERACMTCHGRYLFHRKKLTEEGWKQFAELMSAPGGQIPNLPEQTKELVTSYLGRTFPPGSPPRDLKLDAFEIDEEAVSKAIYIEWELAPPPPQQGKRRLHDAYPARDGTVWFTDTGANSMVQLDPRERNFQKRLTDYPVTTPDAGLHGLTIDSKGHVYWSEMKGNHLGELNPLTGELTSHRFPSKGAMLQVVVDSQDNLWYNLAIGNRIGRLDAETRQFTEWDIPTLDSFAYGLISDHQDQIWWAAIAQDRIGRFNPETEELTEYLTPTQPSGPRRLSVDSQGRIWVAYYFGEALGMFDPKTGQWEEYPFPLRYSQGYDAWTDTDDNVWITESSYDSIVRFDPHTTRFTYYPLPQTGGLPGVPKLEIDSEGTFWFGYRDAPNITAAAFKPYGNKWMD